MYDLIHTEAYIKCKMNITFRENETLVNKIDYNLCKHILKKSGSWNQLVYFCVLVTNLFHCNILLIHVGRYDKPTKLDLFYIDTINMSTYLILNKYFLKGLH